MDNNTQLRQSLVLDDSPAEDDLLGYTQYSSTLADVLLSQYTSTPLTIGIFGAWGSGKTTLMRLTKKQIDDSGASHYFTIWFNAWKYNRESDLWRSLILLVLSKVRDIGKEMIKKDKSFEDFEADIDRIEDSLYRTVEWEEIGRWTIDWFKAVGGTVQGAAEIAVSLVPGGTKLVELMKQTTNSITGKEEIAIADAFRREVTAYRREQIRSLEQFEVAFRELLQKYIAPKNGKLIVFIDDLDRCLPNKAIEVLEAIKLFFDASGCIFVIGMDHDAIVEAIHSRYRDKVKGRLYLEKIIQLSITLPPIEPVSMRHFVRSLVPQMPDARCFDVFTIGMISTPREIKRTINSFLFLWQLSRRNLSDVIHPVRLAKIVVIQNSFPEFYYILREIPQLLKEVELQFFNISNDKETFHSISQVSGDTSVVLPPQVQGFLDNRDLQHLFSLYPQCEKDANFSSLLLEEIRPYIYLAQYTSTRIESGEGVLEPALAVIPSDTISIGDTRNDITSPVHVVQINSFALSRHLVTNYEYSLFILDTGHVAPQYWDGGAFPKDQGDHPVVSISWNDAVSYCKWLSNKTGKVYRLPTEIEWEYAAKGRDNRNWPWGNEWNTSKCNTRECKIAGTTSVGKFSPEGDSVFGVSDMVGNVWEWCSSLYTRYPYSSNNETDSDHVSSERVLRGGSYLTEKDFASCSFRGKYVSRGKRADIGFRVVLETTP